MVPNPAVILFQIPPEAEWFTVIDLYQLFFSVALHEDSPFLFEFRFQEKALMWCRAPQVYTESPSYFNQILIKDLESPQLPCSSTSIQCIDNLLITSLTKEAFKQDTISLLNHLAENRVNAHPRNCKSARKEVKYRGIKYKKGVR